MSYILFRRRGVMNTKEVKNVYYAFLQYVLLCELIIYGGANGFQCIQDLFVGQKMTVKVILNKPTFYTSIIALDELEVLIVVKV